MGKFWENFVSHKFWSKFEDMLIKLGKSFKKYWENLNIFYKNCEETESIGMTSGKFEISSGKFFKQTILNEL